MSITKAELVQKAQEAINAQPGVYMNKATVSSVLDAVFDAIRGTLATEGTVSVRNFGTFTSRPQQGRTMKGLDGQPIEVQAYKIISFKASRSLKNSLNGR